MPKKKPQREVHINPQDIAVVDTETPEGAAFLLDMVIAFLAGHSGKPANELRHKLDNLADEERRALVAYLSKPTHEGGRA
jgi:hypothetical protein